VTKAEFFHEVVKREMLGYPVASVKEIFADPQLEARGFCRKSTTQNWGVYRLSGGFAKFSEGRVKSGAGRR
jgi:crotonobetainyl-CoA:carnitine CoA-transferase CaiB-like acyl-CoA transferase